MAIFLGTDPAQDARWLAYAKFLSTRALRFQRDLLSQYPDPGSLLRTADTELGEGQDWRQELRKVISSARAENFVTPFSAELQPFLLRIIDDDYPPLLAQCTDAPPVLFGLGDPSCLAEPSIAIVGSRKPSIDGRRTAKWFSRELSEAGFTVVSGLAMGIDREAHNSCLQAGAKTIAVMATGLDRIYPSQHLDLAYAIASSGALITQFFPNSAPHRSHFPRRNRTISGLTAATVVIEAGDPSGSLITATSANEQGRDVFVVPWSPWHRQGRGSLRLLREGALLAASPSDVILQSQFSSSVQVRQMERMELTNVGSALEKTLLQMLGDGEHTLGALINETSIAAPEVTEALLALELKGLIRQDNGVYFASP